MITISRRGFSEAVQIVSRAMPKAEMVRVVRDVTSRLSGYTSSITPVDTGAMRDSWTWVSFGLTGQVYISLSAYNPRSGIPVIQYAPIVDERVGLVDAAMVEGGRIAVSALREGRWLPR